MKRKQLQSNPVWARTTKKHREKREQAEQGSGQEIALRGELQQQVLSWEGLAAALSFCVPFVVVVATGVHNALAITIILLMVLLPVGLLRFALREKLNTPGWLAAPVCALAAAGIIAFAGVLLRQYFPQVSESLGTYLYLLAAYPVAAAVGYGKKAGKASTTVMWTLRSVLYMGMFSLLAGGVRELLAQGRLAGLELPVSFRLTAAAMPFFGFIMMGLVLAAVTAVHNMVRGSSATPPAEAPGEAPQQKESDGV